MDRYRVKPRAWLTALVGGLVMIASQTAGAVSPPDSDPRVPPELEEAEKRIRAGLESQNGNDWYPALTSLAELSDPQNVWVKELLVEFLDAPKAQENPRRTEFILHNELMLKPWPGEDILRSLVSRDSEFQPQVREVLESIVAPPAGQERLRSLLQRVLADGAPDEFPRIFAIVAPLDPVTAVGSVLDSIPEGSSFAAGVETTLLDFLGQSAPPPKGWGEWWASQKPRLIQILLENRARQAVERDRERWSEATAVMRGRPEQLRDWLLKTLLDQRIPIRALALAEVEGLVQRLKANGSGPVAEKKQRIELLRPLPETLLTVAQDPNSTQQIQLEALQCLGELDDFFSDPQHHTERLVSALRQWLEGLQGAEVGSRAYLLGLEAAEVAGKLEVQVGPEIETVLDAVLKEWKPLRDPLVLTLLESLRSIGPRPETVEVMAAVFNSDRAMRPEAPERYREAVEDAVKVLDNPQKVAGFSDRVLEFYTKILDSGQTGKARQHAIIALGNLRLAAGIKHLVPVILAAESGEAELRSRAVSSLGTIGGEDAIDAFGLLLNRLPAEDRVLRDEIMKGALNLCRNNENLGLIERFLLGDDTPERKPWVDAVFADVAVRKLLDPESIPPALRTADLRNRWRALRLVMALADLGRLESEEDPEREAAGYAALVGSVTRALEQLPSGLTPEEQAEIDLEPFERLKARSRFRVDLLLALKAENAKACLESLNTLRVDEENPGNPHLEAAEELRWLIERLRVRRLQDPRFEQAVVAGIRVFETDGLLDEDTVSLLNGLQSRPEKDVPKESRPQGDGKDPKTGS